MVKSQNTLLKGNIQIMKSVLLSMQKKFWLTFSGVVITALAFGQIKKQFVVENQEDCQNVKLILKANSGNCFIKPAHSNDILTVYSNQDIDAYAHKFNKEVINNTCHIKLGLEEMRSDGFSQTISTRVFGASSGSSNDKFWKMYLTDSRPYFLEFIYGVGNANMDLSGLSIKNLKITTGSADVNVGYYSQMENKIDMDTFYIKVDVGTAKVKSINLSRAKYIVADVGFGNMMLDFSDKPLVANEIKGSVGAGNLIIIMPQEDVPVLVKIRDSWLCSVSMPKNLKKIKDNTFVNAAYSNDSKGAMVFNLDVSMGNIIFKDKLD